MNRALLFSTIAVIVAFAAFSSCAAIRRKALFYPTHRVGSNGLETWMVAGELFGFARPVPGPENVWLMVHGNGGQAADRVYALPAFSPRDSVFILEYPGYGSRPGKPSKPAFDDAAARAYRELRRTFPHQPICVAAESIGSGPSSLLARESTPPDKLVLIVPFDDLKSVAADHLPYFPVGLVLGASWNNVSALATYKGPVEIFAAQRDTIIPVYHAQKLAASLPQAKLHLFDGEHNDWSTQSIVKIRNP